MSFYRTISCREIPPNNSRLVLGQRLNDDEFDAIIQEADLDGDRHIDYKEFLEARSHPALCLLFAQELMRRNKMMKR